MLIPVFLAYMCVKREALELLTLMLTLGCMNPYPSSTRPFSGLKMAWLRGWEIVPMSFLAESIGSCVSSSRVIMYRIFDLRFEISGEITKWDVSPLPERRFPSSVREPLFRSQQIHFFWRALKRRFL